MPTVVPESVWVHGQERRSAALGEALEALLEFTGATAGWVGLIGTEGRLSFPVTRGRFSPAWLALQQGPGVWGFEIREGPTLLNELPALPALGDPPLSNLLSCPITSGGVARGHVVLANKPNGFTSPDSSVLLGFAHWMSKWLLSGAGGGPPTAAELVPLLRRALDHLADGVLVVDAAGTLVFANARWSSWTGFPAEELVGRPAPFPFWVSHRELAALANRSAGPAQPAGVFPFRHRSDSVFWCQLETVAEELGGRLLTFAFLQRVPPTSPASASQRLPIHYSFLDLAEDLPFALALTDREGMVLWANGTFLDTVARTAEIAELPLRTWFTGASAAALEHLFRTPAAQRGQVGRLALERPDETGTGGLMAYWLPASLPDGPGFLFAFSDDWEALCPPDDVSAAWQRSRPGLARLALLLQPGAEVQFWDERWQALTGLSAGDLAGVPSELVLDWLFPRQSDRERVADLLNLPLPRQPARLLLQVLDRTASRPLSCTFLPVGGEGKERWLLLAGAPDGGAAEEGPAMAHVRQFARGLGHLLNHHLAAPLGLAELAADRSDLPRQAIAQFEQIRESCQGLTALIGLLQDLGAVTAGDMKPAPLAEVVREYFDEQTALGGGRPYELRLELCDADLSICINRRMLKTVLGHLLSNAEQALAGAPQRRVEVRVFAREDTACCEIEDTGEGLPAEDWTSLLAPYYSTKGPFARDAAHAALEGTGLGLTVSQHLLALQGGRLELHSRPGAGTVATIILPRGDAPPDAGAPRTVRRARADAPLTPLEPKGAPKVASIAEPPAGQEEK